MLKALARKPDKNYLRLDCDCGTLPVRASKRTIALGAIACMICGKFYTVSK